MICVTQKTLKASPLNSRGCIAPPERSNECNIDPNGVARAHGRPSHVGRWSTPSECFPLLPLTPAGRTDLRLLSGDAFSVKQLRTSIMVGNFSSFKVKQLFYFKDRWVMLKKAPSPHKTPWFTMDFPGTYNEILLNILQKMLFPAFFREKRWRFQRKVLSL